MSQREILETIITITEDLAKSASEAQLGPLSLRLTRIIRATRQYLEVEAGRPGTVESRATQSFVDNVVRFHHQKTSKDSQDPMLATSSHEDL